MPAAGGVGEAREAAVDEAVDELEVAPVWVAASSSGWFELFARSRGLHKNSGESVLVVSFVLIP